MYAYLQKNPTSDWGYAVRKTSLAGRSTRTGIPWPRGKMIGGSGSIDYLSYTRGNSRDYDQWQELGNPSWGWTDNVLEYFKKSEHITAESYANNIFHGHNGPVRIGKNNATNPIQAVLLRAAAEIGYPYVANHDEQYIGYADGLFYIDNGERFSAAKAFLTPAKDRSNLHVIKYAHVTNLVIDRDTRIVSGVEFLLNGQRQVAKSKVEVVLTAGAIGTPQILLLSGIGPRKDLENLNIHCNADLMVGHNLQDHLYALLFYKVKRDTDDAKTSADSFYEYLAHRTGRLTMSLDINLVGFFNAVNASDPFPNVQMHHLFFPKNDPSELKRFIENDDYTDDVMADALEANKEHDLFVVATYLLLPKSVGTIKLQSTDPLDEPLIEANYLSHNDDVSTLINNIRFVREMEKSKEFQRYFEFLPFKIDDCNEEIEDSLGYWECFVRNMPSTTFHPIGTAKMGPDTDINAVVDSRLKIRGGLTGLRVADASIMPIMIAGNTNAAAIMIGEKGAAFIDEEYP